MVRNLPLKKRRDAPGDYVDRAKHAELLFAYHTVYDPHAGRCVPYLPVRGQKQRAAAAAAAAAETVIVIDDDEEQETEKDSGAPVLSRPPKEEQGLEVLDLPVVEPGTDLAGILGCVRVLNWTMGGRWMPVCKARAGVSRGGMSDEASITSQHNTKGSTSTTRTRAGWRKDGCTLRPSGP